MISTISQHKINTNCLNQYNKGFQKFEVNLLKSILISLVFGKTLMFRKGKSAKSLLTSTFSAKVGEGRSFTGTKLQVKTKLYLKVKQGVKELASRENVDKQLTGGYLNTSHNIWGLLLFSREDLAFVNLRGLLSTLLKALQVCLFALLNNKRIIFVGDAQPLVQEHHQRLLSCFIANQAKVFNTDIGLKLPPFLPCEPKTDKDNAPSRQKSNVYPFLPLARDTQTLKRASLTRPTGSEATCTKGASPSAFQKPGVASPLVKQVLTKVGTAYPQSKLLQGVKDSLFGNLHALANTQITKLDKVSVNEYAPAINCQSRRLAFTNILSSGQSILALAAKAKAESLKLNKQQPSNKKTTYSIQPQGSDKSLSKAKFSLSVKGKMARGQENNNSRKTTKANTRLSLPADLSALGKSIAPALVLSQVSSVVDNLGHKKPLYKEKPANLSQHLLESRQKLMGFQTYKPLYFESTKMGEGFSLKKNFRVNRVSNTVDLRQRLGLSSTKVKNGVSKIIDKSVPFDISPKLQSHDTYLNTYNNSILCLKGSFVESQPLSPAPQPLPHVGKVSKDNISGQDLTESVKNTLDSNLAPTAYALYVQMAKLVSKAAIRSSQWTATLAQPTNYWIGGFFSNSSATYKQNLSSTTLLNIKMDLECQLQQFRDLYSKSKSAEFIPLDCSKYSKVSEKALLDFRQSKELLIATLAKKKGLKNKLSTRFNVSIDTLPSSALELTRSGLGETGSLSPSAFAKNQPANKQDEKLFFEKSFFSITTDLPLSNYEKTSAAHLSLVSTASQEQRSPGHLLDSISEFSGGLWSAIYAPVARKRLVNKPETLESYAQRKPALKSFRGQIPAKIKIYKKQKGRKVKRVNEKIMDHCLNSIHVNNAKNAWLNEADLVFFANPEKNLSLLNQINRLKIPTIGIINSGSDLAFPFTSVKGPSLLSAKQTITYPIIGNANSLHFLRIVLTKISQVLGLKRHIAPFETGPDLSPIRDKTRGAPHLSPVKARVEITRLKKSPSR